MEETNLGARPSWLAMVERAVVGAMHSSETKKTMALEVGDGVEELMNLCMASLEEGGDLGKEGVLEEEEKGHGN